MGTTVQRWICAVAVALVGLMAGLMLGTGMDQYTHRQLDAAGWVTEHQVMDALFRRVLPAAWNATLLLLVVAAVVTRGRVRALFGTAAVIFLVSLVITVRVEVPMNRAIALWDVHAIPADWMAVRDRWLQFHLGRTVGGLVAFVCGIVGLTTR